MKFAVVGHVEWVEFLRVGRVPAPGDIVHASEWWSTPGGGGAVAAGQLAKLAGGADFFTALGDDELGHRAAAELEALGIRVHASFHLTPQRRAVTHIDEYGERTITVMGARLGPATSDPLPWADLAKADAVYFTAGTEDVLKLARKARRLVATARTLPILVGAGVQLDALVGSVRDPSESFRSGDVDPPPHLCVWTDGPRGGTWQTEKRETNSFEPSPPPGPVADAYGCGDSFAAGLTFGLGRGLEPAEAIALAARCGSAVLTGRGPFEAQLASSE